MVARGSGLVEFFLPLAPLKIVILVSITAHFVSGKPYGGDGLSF
jgi:hypothetical protein